MIVNGRTVPEGESIDVDLCIVGSGPAGLTLARALDNTNLRICLVETGDRHPSAAASDLADGDNAGYPYFPLRSSVERVFGGSSYVWDEHMRARPLDPIDFEKRDGVAHSGWPITSADLDPYYAKAAPLLGLKASYELTDYQDPDRPQLALPSSGDVQTCIFQYSDTGDFTRHWKAIEKSANVALFTDSTVTEFVLDESRQRVDRAEILSTSGSSFSVAARSFISATGGIQNARILLVSRRHIPRGIGNEHGLVGRFFMEHPRVRSGILVLEPHHLLRARFYAQHPHSGIQIRGALTVSPEAMKREGLLNTMFLLAPSDPVRGSDTFRSAALLRRALRNRGRPVESLTGHFFNLLGHPFDLFRMAATAAGSSRFSGRPVFLLSATVEQAPNPSSRVMLGDRQDSNGLPLPVLDWRLTSHEADSIRAVQVMIDRELRRAGIGRLDFLLGDELPSRVFNGEWHHAGTTRMHQNPRSGVVDADCRVHTTQNLYMAGSSVFPTVGHANPTLTIVALALRLADHLRATLASGMGAWW